MSRIDEWEHRRGEVRQRGIPTVLRSRRYRSRLEAKWAAFFDLLGWRFEYEPFDCDGWIPDFAITTVAGFTLVEVKPVTLPTPDVYEKIERANTDGHEVLVVGLAPFQTRKPGYSDSCLGWIAPAPRTCWRECLLHTYYAGSVSKIGFSVGDSACRVSGQSEILGLVELPEIEALWSRAANTVQWKGATA